MSDKAFEIRAYGKQELAVIYHPKVTTETAMKRMRNWFRVNPRLRYLIDKKIHSYTPKQVRQIVEEVGEP